MHTANKSIRFILPRPQSSSIQTDDRCAFLFEKNNPQKLVFLLVLSSSSFLRGRLCGSIQLSNSDLLYLSIGASPILRVRSRRVKNDWYLVDGCVPLSSEWMVSVARGFNPIAFSLRFICLWGRRHGRIRIYWRPTPEISPPTPLEYNLLPPPEKCI